MRGETGWRQVGAFVTAMLVAMAGAGCGSDDGGSQTPGANAPYSASLAAELCRLCLESYQALDDFQSGQPFTLPAPYTLRQQYYTPEDYPGELAAPTATDVPIAFVATAGQTIYVVFRGTKTITEWIDDATFNQVPNAFVSSGGKVEAGFTKIYETIHDPIVQTVTELIAQGGYTTLYVTGHSLGAALATLAAPELQARTTLAPQVYTFAGPRAGDPIFALRYDGLVPASFRIANTNDIVPTLPPVSVVYYHDGRFEVFFYEHVDVEKPITFGKPITGPLDFKDIENNHSSCNYYATLCDQTANPAACKQAGEGIAGCTFG